MTVRQHVGLFDFSFYIKCNKHLTFSVCSYWLINTGGDDDDQMVDL